MEHEGIEYCAQCFAKQTPREELSGTGMKVCAEEVGISPDSQG